MVNYCPNCGKKVNPADKFCKICGSSLAGSVEVSKEKLRSKMPSVPTQIPPKPSKSSWSTITSILALVLIVVGFFGVLLTYQGGGTYGAPCTRSDRTGIYGTDGNCYTCPEGTPVTSPISRGCSEPVAGVYCCGGGTSGGGGTVREYFTYCTGCQRGQDTINYRGYDYSRCNYYWQLCNQNSCLSKRSNCAG